MKKRRLQTVEARLNAYVNKTDTCWLWTRDTYNYGYGKLAIGQGKQVRAHRYMYEKHRGPIPEDMNVLHSCDTPQCVNPEHLFLGTQKDNMSDAREKGRIGYKSFSGESHWASKLTMERVDKMRSMWRSGLYFQSELAKLFGVSQQVVSKVVNNKGWLKNGETIVKINKE